jgi:RNA polymerase sigma-70 factor, ECF subfamily
MQNRDTLLRAVRRMDGEALAQSFDLYAPGIYKYAFRHCRNPWAADEIVGEVFARLLEHLSHGQGPVANLRSYLFEIASHQVVDEVRSVKRTAPLEAVEFTAHEGISLHMNVENRIVFEPILRAIKNDLTDYQRHVVILRFFEGFSMRDTARILGKSEKHVKAAQNRAIVKLRKVLDDEKHKYKFTERRALA